MPTERGAWAEMQTLEGWAGEIRVNLVRLIAVLGFYGYHLLNYYLIAPDTLTPQYHAMATLTVLAWTAGIIGLHACLARRYSPPILKYLSTGYDLLLITVLLTATEQGPRHPLVMLYFLVIAAAPLRLSMRLALAAALGAILGYLVVLGHYAWIEVGYERYYSEMAVRVPRSHQVLMVLGLAGAGLLAAQAVRQLRRVAEGYPVRLDDAGEDQR